MPTLPEDVKRDIGEHLVVGFHGHELSEDIKILVRDYHVGNIIFMKRNIQNTLQVRRIVREIQTIAKESGHKRPLLIGIDQENGLVSAFSSPTAGTQFPGAMALAAGGSVELAERTAAGIAKELVQIGINWAYSPVADVNSDSRNPVIGVRSFGDDPTEVGRYAYAVSQGLTWSGVAPTAKHFPGHGDTHVDSHLALPRILKTKEELITTELVPFKRLIDTNIRAIMTGHIALPLITGDDTPSSLSRTITTDLLRVELGYKGVVVTDCLEMDAVAVQYGSETAAVESLKAGADMVMICHTMERQKGAIEKIWKAVADKSIDPGEFKVSGDRIALLKDQFVGGWTDVFGDGDIKNFENEWEVLKMKNRELSSRAYAGTIALINDPFKALPISRDGTTLLFTPEMESLNKAVDGEDGVLINENGEVRNTAGASFLAFATSISARTQSQHVVYSQAVGLPPGVDVENASAILFVLRNADRSTWQIDYLRRVLGRVSEEDQKKVVLLSCCAPYDLVGVEGVNLAYVASFEFTAEALEAAAVVIFGEKEAKGKVPVLGGNVILSQ